MRGLPLHGIARGIHAQGNDRIQTQEEHVHKVFLADAVRGKVGVQQAQAAQTFLPGSTARQFGNENAARLPHQHHLHPPLAVNEQTQLTAYGA